MQHMRWDHGLKVTGDGAGQCGLTAALEATLAQAGKSP